MAGVNVPLLEPAARYFECPKGCGARERSFRQGVITITHRCREENGLDVPLQEAGRHGLLEPAHHIRFVDRGDMSNGDRVAAHGKMAVHAVRPDGSYDTVVFAPPARLNLNGEDT